VRSRSRSCRVHGRPLRHLRRGSATRRQLLSVR